MKRVVQFLNPFTLIPCIVIFFILATQDAVQWLLIKVGYYDHLKKKRR